MTPATAVRAVADGLIAIDCVLLAVILLAVRRLFRWPDLRVVFIAFSVLCGCAAVSHALGLLALWDARWKWTFVAATCATAAMTLVAGLLLFFLLQGWRNVLLDPRLRAKVGW